MVPFFEVHPEFADDSGACSLFVDLRTDARRRKIARAMHILVIRAIEACEGVNAAGARGEY